MPSTPTEALLDVNLLIAAVFADHVNHVMARRFVEGLSRFYTTPTTQGGFLRFATRPWKDVQKQEQPPRLSMTDALERLRELTAVETHAFLPDDEPFVGLEARQLQGHRQWTDAYLLRLARQHKLTVASLDSRMASLDLPATPVFFLVANVST
jgi:toxin-antitoxin system PIN domain toxin